MFGFFKKKEKKAEAAENVGNWEFKLTLNKWGSEKITENPTDIDLENAVEALKLSNENFLILDSAATVDGFTFIQATDCDCEKNTVYVEAQISDKSGKKEVLKNYGNTLGTEELTSLLKAFKDNVAPDIDGWEHTGDFH